MRLTVVSWPATSNKMAVDKSSPSLSTSPCVFGQGQLAQQVRARAPAALGQQPKEVLGERQQSVDAGLADLVGEQELGVEAPGQRGGPVAEEGFWSTAGTPSRSQMMRTGSG